MEPEVPNNIALLLHAARTLLGYGRHLIDTICLRATAPNFNAIAACFGTANLSTIFAHLNRGILRAAALERVLLARAATGRDIPPIDRDPAPPAQPASLEPPQNQTTAAPPAMRKLPPPPSLPAGRDDPEFSMPTIQDLERQVRRRPIGRTILDICLDLAVVPGFCTGDFWNELFDSMHFFGGSIATLMQESNRRRQAFAKEQDRKIGSNWD